MTNSFYSLLLTKISYMKKKSIYLLLMLCLGLAGYGQSHNSRQSDLTNYVAIENQSGIEVSYVFDNSDNPSYFFVKITNRGSKEQTVEFKVANQESVQVSASHQPMKIKPGESFEYNDLTMIISLNEESNYSAFKTSLSIKE